MTARCAALVLSLVLAIGACTAPDPRHGDGGAPSCHHDCFVAWLCVDGVVHQRARGPIPCDEWTGECPHAPAGVECERGCREGLAADRPADVCEENIVKDEGDPCTTPEDCVPGRPEPDAFGGTTELALGCHLASGTCLRALVEECDGDDDDGDGEIDEGCGCSARVVADVASEGVARDVAFGP